MSAVRRAEIAPPDLPETVRNEVLLPARGETRYELVLADEDVELLASGMCSERVAREAYVMLEWKRRHFRKTAQDAERLHERL